MAATSFDMIPALPITTRGKRKQEANAFQPPITEKSRRPGTHSCHHSTPGPQMSGQSMLREWAANKSRTISPIICVSLNLPHNPCLPPFPPALQEAHRLQNSIPLPDSASTRQLEDQLSKRVKEPGHYNCLFQ